MFGRLEFQFTIFKLWAWLFSPEFYHLLKVVGTMVGIDFRTLFCLARWLV